MTTTTILSDNGVSSGSAGIKTTGGNDGTLALQTTTAGGAATTAVTIDTSQNVGIGSTPTAIGAYKVLEVNGTSGAYISLKQGGTEYGNIYNNSTDGTTISASGARNIISQTNGTERMRIDSSGNVGIGTASPADNLHVVANTTSENGIRVQNLNASGQSAVQYYNNAGTQKADIWWNNNGSTFNIRTLSTDPMIFNTNNTERMRIDSSGNLLVGTTATALGNVGCQIFAAGYYQATSNGAPAMILKRGSNDGAIVDFYDSMGTRRGYINVTTSATTYNTISDYRLKENVIPMTNALAKVQALKPVTYTWKADGSSGQGFIAHELQSVIPDCVVGQKDAIDADGNPDYQGIDTSFLVATLTAAIQEQQTLITALTARITALENKT